MAGINEDVDSMMSKPLLNSVAAYLTGSLPEVPSDLYRDHSMGRHEIAFIVASECDIYTWLDDYSKAGQDGRDPRPFNKSEVCVIENTMKERGDQRPWVSPHVVE